MKEMTQKEKELVANFNWDDEGVAGYEIQPESVLATSVFECVDKIHQYVMNNMQLENLAGDDTMEVNIPASIDPLLEARYDESYSEESRLQMFDLLRAAFRFKLDDIGFQIAEKINGLMPQQNEDVRKQVDAYVKEMELNDVISGEGGIQRRIHVTRCDLHDEPSMDITVTQKVRDEIVDTKTESCKKMICAEITFESRRIS